MAENRLNWFWDTFDEYLITNNLNKSKQRTDITKVLLELSGHISAEQLHKAVKDCGFKSGLATVYRTLNFLVEANLAEQHSFADGSAIFEIKHPGDHHDHLVCEDCGKVFEFEEKAIEDQQLEVAKRLGFTLTSHRLDLFGKCEKVDCSNRKK